MNLYPSIMKDRICLLFILHLLIATVCTSSIQAQGWENTYPSPMLGLSMLFDAKPTPDGGFIAVGETDLPTGAIRHFVHLVKTDADGNLEWQKDLNDNTITYETGRNIWPLPEGGYLLVGTKQLQPTVNSSIYLVRLNEVGDTLWTRENEQVGGFTIAESIYPTPDGGYIIGGHTQLDFQQFFWYGFAMKIDAEGNTEWLEEFDTSVNRINDLIPVSSGGYLAIGAQNSDALLIRLNESGQTIWSSTYQLATGTRAYAAIEDTDGGFVLSGSSDGFAGPGPFVMKVDENGEEVWTNFPISLGLGEATDITVHPGGGFVATGSLFEFSFNNPGNTNHSGFITRVSSDGTEVWTKFMNDINADGITAQTASIESTPDGGFILAGTEEGSAFLMKTDSAGNSITNVIQGQIVFDENENCTIENGELPLENWIIEIQSQNDLFYSSTDAEGHYSIRVDTGDYEVRLIVPNDYWNACNMDYSVSLQNFYDTSTLHFLTQAAVLCPNLGVDISTSFLRRCFDNTYYVHYCNDGTISATDAVVEVNLDPFLSMVSATIPYTDLGDNLYAFALDTVEIGACGNFQFTAFLDCDATTLGQTHCVEAHIFPDSLCTAAPTGTPILDVDAVCENDSVLFTITNIGDENMDSPINYIVIEDDVMFMQDEFQLEAGESITITLAANGLTYRLETIQTPGFADLHNNKRYNRSLWPK